MAGECMMERILIAVSIIVSIIDSSLVIVAMTKMRKNKKYGDRKINDGESPMPLGIVNGGNHEYHYNSMDEMDKRLQFLLDN